MSEKNKLQEYCQRNKLPMPKYEAWFEGDPHRPQWSAKVTIFMDGKEITVDTIVQTSSKIAAEKQVAALMFDHIENLKNKDGSKSPSLLTKLKDSTKITITSTHKPIKKNDPSMDDINFLENISDDEIMDYSDYTVVRTKVDDIDDDDDIQIINKIYFIDLENKPCFSKNNIYKKNALYFGFINSIHHSVNKYDEWHKCNSDDIAVELVESGNNKLLFLVDGGTQDLADHLMTAMIYPLIEYMQKTKIFPEIYIISGDHAGWCTRACMEKILKWRKIFNININNVVSIND